MVDRPNKPGAISAPKASSTPQATVDIAPDNSKVSAKLPSGETVEVLLYGASVISWKNKDGSENLWLSEKAALDGSKPVRGGVPVVFPVFGPPPKNHATSNLPQHGFARNNRWEYLGKSTTEAPPTPAAGSSGQGVSDDGVKLDFGLSSSTLPADSKKLWPQEFGLVYSVTLTPEGLQTSLNVRNEGSETFEFQTLLHTYLRIADISKAQITGLVGVSYVDKVLNATTHTESNDKLSITGETDRVYSSIPQDTTSVLSDGKSRFDVVRDNFPDTVVWNPWTEKAKAMGDFSPDDGYKQMICVEVGHVNSWVKLESGEAWEASQLIRSHL